MKRGKILTAVLLTICIFFSRTATVLAQQGDSASVDVVISAGGEATIRILLANDDTRMHTYGLATGLLPDGIKVDFMADGLVSNEVKVDTKSFLPLKLRIASAQKVSEGTHRIDITVRRDDGIEQTIPLTATIDRSYRLSITSTTTGLKVICGDSVKFEVAVVNDGSKELTEASLKLDLPKKWVVKEINPKSVALKPGESRLFKIEVVVPPTQVAGSQAIKVTADSGDVQSITSELPVLVQNNLNILPWLIALVVAVAIGTLLYFRRHGRR